MQSDHRKYQVLEPVGKGGFGTVYRAQLVGAGGFQKIVALKVLNPEVDGAMDFAERLRDEARMLGLLQHRAIVRVDGLQRLNGRWTVVMEYVPGVDLKRLLSQGPMPIAPALELMEEVSDALYSAYERPGPEGEPLRLIHRDIKPSNIHLTPSGEVKVLDFGVARADFQNRESETRSFFFGSLAYMAPERLDAIDTHAGDVYAMGAVLFELICGESLGKTSASPERHSKNMREGVAILKAAGVSPEIEELLQDMLAYEPEDRPTARELTRRIRQLRSVYVEPWLRDWAESVVPRVRLEQEPLVDELSGATLMEQGDVSIDEEVASESWEHGEIPARVAGQTWIQELLESEDEGLPTEEAEVTDVGSSSLLLQREVTETQTELDIPSGLVAEPGMGHEESASQSSSRRGPIFALLVGVIVALGVSAVGIAAFMIWDSDVWRGHDPTPVTSRMDDVRDARVAVYPKSGEEISPTVETSSETSGVGETTEAVETNLPDAKVLPEGSGAGPQEALEPVAETGEVRAPGALIALKRDGREFEAGVVPAGTYVIWAWFSGPHADATRSGEVTVGAGDSIRLTCNAAMKICAPITR